MEHDSNIDPYQILHLNPNKITVDEVKAAYRKMAVLYHPDKFNGDDKLFNKIKNAYHSIMDHLSGRKNNYDFHALKDNYRDFIQNATQSISPELDLTKSTTLEEIKKTESEFDLTKFNQLFVEREQHKTPIPINLPKEHFDDRHKTFFLEKKKIEEKLNKMEKLFNNEPFDKNVFNRQFEHINGDKETRSKGIALYEPVSATSTSTDLQCSLIDGENVSNGNFASIEQHEELTDNPVKIDSSLTDKFKNNPDITRQGPIDHEAIRQKLRELKEHRDHSKNIEIVDHSNGINATT